MSTENDRTYCEICHRWYLRYEQHLKSEAHAREAYYRADTQAKKERRTEKKKD